MFVTDVPAAMTVVRPAANDSTRMLREVRLWIDGVGCWLVWLPETLTIGGPRRLDSTSPAAADLSLLADLRAKHAAIERCGEEYRLTTFGLAANSETARFSHERDVSGSSHLLRSGDEFTLGVHVRFQFSIPTPLSNTARLICASGHRPSERIDGVILLEQMCQLGPQPDHHITCPRAESPLILFCKGGGLWCRSPQAWTLDGRTVTAPAALHNGAVVATDTLSFRLEVNSEN